MHSEASRTSGKYFQTTLTKRQIYLTLAGMLLALFLASLNQNIVSTAMPRIITDLGGFNQYTWVITAYLITSTLIVPISGKLTDLYGRKLFYIISLVIFNLGVLLCGLAQNMSELIAFRALQGLGGGIMMSSSFIVIADLFPPEERGKYSGFLSAVIGISSVIGPILGGYITDNLSWKWVFWINLPLGVLVLAVFLRYFPNLKPAVQNRKVDYPGIAALTAAVVSLLLALSWGGSVYQWSSPVMIITLCFALSMAVVFVIIESRAAEPIIPLSLFKNNIVAFSIIITFVAGIGTFGVITFVPLFLQGVMGSTATVSGTLLMPVMLGIVVGSLVVGQLLSRAGGQFKLLAGLGLLLTVIGLAFLSRMNAQTSHFLSVVFLSLIGLGQGFFMPCFTISVQNAVSNKIMGAATSSAVFFRSIGSTLGLAIFGTIMINRFGSNFYSGLAADVEKIVPADQIQALVDNPQALVSVEAQNSLHTYFSGLGTQGDSLYQTVLQALRDALGSALGEVFLFGCIAVAAAFILNFFFNDKPLRTGRKTGKEQG